MAGRYSESMWNGLRKFWREYATSWARLGKDRRAWPLLARGTFQLVAVPLWLLLALGLLLPGEQRTFQFFFNTLVFGLGFIAFLLLRRANRRNNDLLNTSITGGTPVTPPSNEVNSGVRDYLLDRYSLSAHLSLEC